MRTASWTLDDRWMSWLLVEVLGDFHGVADGEQDPDSFEGEDGDSYHERRIPEVERVSDFIVEEVGVVGHA